MSMLKSDLIDRLANKLPHLSIQDVALSVNTLLESMTSTLKSGGHIEIRGFGSFSLHYQRPRMAHNPRTGEKLTTLPKYRIGFKSGKALRELVNNSRHLEIQSRERR